MRPLCGTKQPWATFDLAEGHRLLLVAAGKAYDPSRLHSYRCPECDNWHVGHSRHQVHEQERAS